MRDYSRCASLANQDCRNDKKNGADYVFIIKGNQEGIKKEIQAALTNPAFVPYLIATQTLDKGHGRIDWRQITVLPGNPTSQNLPGAAQIFQLERQRSNLKGELISQETVVGVTSIKLKNGGTPERLLEYTRGHWHIENKLHYVRDVTFNEDRACQRAGNGPHVMATLRNLAINIFRRADVPVAESLLKCAWDRKYLFSFFSQTSAALQ